MRPPIFSVTLMRSSGSRVDWKIFFVIFTKLIPRNNFFLYCKHFGVDGRFLGFFGNFQDSSGVGQIVIFE